jgi:hypothetical protein
MTEPGTVGSRFKQLQSHDKMSLETSPGLDPMRIPEHPETEPEPLAPAEPVCGVNAGRIEDEENADANCQQIVQLHQQPGHLTFL